MKVLQVLHKSLPWNVGGVQTFGFELTKALKRLGHESIIVTSNKTASRRSTISHHRIHEVDIYRMWSGESCGFVSKYRNADCENMFRDLLERLQPDVIHFHHFLDLSAGLPNVAANLGIRSVLTIHDYWLQCAYGQRIMPTTLEVCRSIDQECCADCVAPLVDGGANNLERLSLVKQRSVFMRDMLSQLASLIAPSRFMQSEFADWCSDVAYIPYGIDLNRFTSEKFIPSKIPRLTFVGRLARSKGVHVLLQSMKDVARNVELTIYGPESNSPKYQREIEFLASEDSRVKIAGPISHDMIHKLYAKTDAIIVPSIWMENSPLVVHEAIASGINVVASDIGGLSELLQGKRRHRLFTAGDPNELSAILEDMPFQRGHNSSEADTFQVVDIEECATCHIEVYTT
tara:strand:+ start:341 stop:1546 length:1206 start_codon:yes stop_codon:yes gene_type:complete